MLLPSTRNFHSFSRRIRTSLAMLVDDDVMAIWIGGEEVCAPHNVAVSMQCSRRPQVKSRVTKASTRVRFGITNHSWLWEWPANNPSSSFPSVRYKAFFHPKIHYHYPDRPSCLFLLLIIIWELNDSVTLASNSHQSRPHPPRIAALNATSIFIQPPSTHVMRWLPLLRISPLHGR